VRFVLEVDMAGFGDQTGAELGRILRYWGGALPKMELTDGTAQAIYDSQYREVGRWTVTSSE
jgi:hypothetical protein